MQLRDDVGTCSPAALAHAAKAKPRRSHSSLSSSPTIVGVKRGLGFSFFHGPENSLNINKFEKNKKIIETI